MGTMLYSIIFQRAPKYDSSDGPPIEGNVKLEIVWTAIPILLVIWIAGFSYQTYDRMSILGAIEPRAMGMATAEAATLAVEEPTQPPIEVYARQWAWEFYYPDQDIRSTELHLPVDQRAQLLLSSEDVLHGFFVPAFRIKQDVVPGREIDFEFTPIREGRYRLRDSEYSGTYFAANQTNVVVESSEDYKPGAPDNWKRFFSFNTDAKVIGIQYMVTALLFLLVGGLLAMVMRGELITPPADLVDPTVYNGLYTMHGTVMLFLFLFPILNGFNNLLIP
jgi:heme/copper-type cytochrome/quinol oxidase subunit 2